MPVTRLRLAGSFLALALGAVLAFVSVVALSLIGVREKTLVTIATGMAPALAGLFLAGWNKPQLFISPLHTLWSWLNSRLVSWQQRALLLLSIALALPWLLARVIGETFETSSIAEYARSAYYPIANTLFTVTRWGYEPEWFEWLFLLGVSGTLLSVFWSVLVQPIVGWVRGGRQ